MSENPLKSACTRAEFMAAQKAGIWVMTTEDEQAIHDFAEAIREEQRARIAELELEIVPVREMLEDARTQLDMIREALGVSVEPHQSLFERVMESAQRVKALEQELKTERCLSFRNQVAELERKNEILTDAVSKSCSPFISTKEQLRICRDALAAAQPLKRQLSLTNHSLASRCGNSFPRLLPLLGY